MNEGFRYSEQVIAILQDLQQWVLTNLVAWDSVRQLAILLGVFLLGRLLKSRLERVTDLIKLPGHFSRYEDPIHSVLKPLALPVFLILVLWFSVFALHAVNHAYHVVNLVVSLLNAWVVIRFASTFIKDPGWSRLVSVTAWTIAALNIIGLLDVTMAFLDSMSFSFGEMKFSLLGLVKGVIAVSVLFWGFSLLETVLKRKIAQLQNITPSAKVLLKKFLRIILVIVGILLAMDAMGIDLTALAVFSGAIGIGLGFGLQKVAANLVSGFILLLDHSVKPGDVISLGNTYGKIDKLRGRYVSVITRDGTEHLIPNEELITQRVENWSFTDTNVRQRTLVGIDYSADIKLAIRLCEDAANEIPRIVKIPAPRCLLREFADSSVHIELRYWVCDPENGLGSVRSDVLMLIWDKFHEHGVAFPYPQRDIHVKGVVPIRLEKGED